MGRTTPVLNYDKSATIAASGNSSALIDVDGNTLCGIFIPADFEGTELTFEHAADSAGAFVPIMDELGAAIAVTVSADSYAALSPAQFAGVRFLKIKATTIQAAQRELVLAVRSV